MKAGNDQAVCSEADLLPLSGLQHLAFCERQCALIHIEQVWAENRLTAQGRILHEKVHRREDELRGEVRIARGLRIRSQSLGLIGQADVVEFHRRPDGLWQPHPVEYKRGRSKPDDCDRVQLCAQAMCLEEMLRVDVPEGALFYGEPRRREIVIITAELREKTIDLAARLRVLIESGRTPPARYEKRCEGCSLLEICRPRLSDQGRSARRYMSEILEVAD